MGILCGIEQVSNDTSFAYFDVARVAHDLASRRLGEGFTANATLSCHRGQEIWFGGVQQPFLDARQFLSIFAEKRANYILGGDPTKN